jgi:hypothetical protein
MPMSLMFEKLGAPLHNKVWSWGATTEDENTVYLRVWQNETTVIDGKNYVLIYAEEVKERKRAGHSERRRHVNLIRSGASCYLIFCEPKKPLTMPRKVLDYISDRVYPTGELIEHQQSIWIEYLPGIPFDRHIHSMTRPVLIKAA